MTAIKHAIVDFDGVFYPLNALGGREVFDHIHRTSLTHAAMAVHPDINRQQEEFLNGIADFEDYAEALFNFALPRGRSNTETLIAMHTFQGAYHQNLFEMVKPHGEKIFTPARALRQSFADVQARNVTLGILSMADKQHWINPALECMGLKGLFKYTIDYGDCDFVLKEASPEPVAKALYAGGCESGEAVFIDDRLHNLEVAKTVFPELTTIWVKPERRGELPSHVDHHTPDLKGALALILKLG
jgi:FMN phosphatase YigB (HAD superfamily)